MLHRMDDHACMWNGVEDLYIRDTGETLSPKFFFCAEQLPALFAQVAGIMKAGVEVLP